MAEQNRLMNILQVASIIKNNEQKRAKDSSEMDKKKRERKANYSRSETDRLVALIIPKKDILENKKNGSNQWQEKKQAWEDIEKEFNHNSDGSNYRDSKTLRIKYESLKRDIKRKWSSILGKRCDANGKLPKLTAAEKKIKEIMQLPIEDGFCDFSSMNEKSDYDDDGSSDSGPNITHDSEWLPVKEETKHSDEEETRQFDELSDDDEPPSKRMHGDHTAKKHDTKKAKNVPIEFKSLSESLSKKTHEDPLIPIPSNHHPCSDDIDTSIKEQNLAAARLQTDLLRHELEIKKLQIKIMEEELVHKRAIHELEKQNLVLKIQSFQNGK